MILEHCDIEIDPTKGAEFEEATEENSLTGKYPLSRALYVYINKAPGKALDPMVKEFMTLVLSKEGQSVVEKDGYVALPAVVAAKELAKLN